MNEVIKEDNNCIVKAFENNPIAIITEEIDNKKIYCFKASDIGKALNLTNIRASIQNYDEDEQVVRKAYDLRGCEQDTTFLTSQGVYRLLYNSKKEAAKKFRKWAGNILDDIIFNESAELKKQLDETKNELEAKNLLIKKKDKELKQLAKKVSLDWLYVATSNGINDISKIGIAEEILDRIDNHLSSNPGFKYIFTYQSKNNKVIEKCIKAVLDPFLTNKKEWFNIDSKDLVYIVEFFIDLFDKNNGSEDPKMIVDFIKRLRSKNIIEKDSNEYLPNKIYNEFFEEHIDTISDRMYRGKPIQPKLSFLELENKLEKWIIDKNYKIQIRNNSSNNFLEKYKNDIKRYVKETYNLDLKTININDIKKNIAIGGNLGYIGIKFKNTETDNFFTNEIYDNYCKNNIILSTKAKITIKELLINFNNWLETQKIEKPINLITKGCQFSYLFKQEFRIMIENYTKIIHTKKLNTLGYSGYPGFIGIKINI
jgi:prophage antirepressor-like protein